MYLDNEVYEVYEVLETSAITENFVYLIMWAHLTIVNVLFIFVPWLSVGLISPYIFADAVYEEMFTNVNKMHRMAVHRGKCSQSVVKCFPDVSERIKGRCFSNKFFERNSREF